MSYKYQEGNGYTHNVELAILSPSLRFAHLQEVGAELKVSIQSPFSLKGVMKQVLMQAKLMLIFSTHEVRRRALILNHNWKALVSKDKTSWTSWGATGIPRIKRKEKRTQFISTPAFLCQDAQLTNQTSKTWSQKMIHLAFLPGSKETCATLKKTSF